MNPLTSILGSIVIGVVLVIALVFISGHASDPSFLIAPLERWLHIVSGVTWIGLLYYFNVVQVPGLAEGAADAGGPGNAGISKYIAPRALLWFRWAAVATWLTGAYYVFQFYGGLQGLHNVFALRNNRTIGIGAWLGTFMLFNVWVFIWPNQKKILGLTPATNEQKAKARKVALLASRTNFALSLPMLLCMAGQAHGLAF